SFYYLRARWMNPATGRFVTRDPYEGDGAVSCCKDQQFTKMVFVHHHLYEYTRADPVNWIDPSGRTFEEDAELQANLGILRGYRLYWRLGQIREIQECAKFATALFDAAMLANPHAFAFLALLKNTYIMICYTQILTLN